MKKNLLSIIITLSLSIYLSVVLMTDYSLVGFWTDIIVSITGILISIYLWLSSTWENKLVSSSLKYVNVFWFLLFIGIILKSVINPSEWDSVKITSFMWQNIHSNQYHAYFYPVGSYSGGEGNLMITQSVSFLPIIEHEIYYKHGVLHNFGEEIFDGQEINNELIIRNLIEEEIFKKR